MGAIRQVVETMKDAEQRIHTAFEVEEEHATAMKAIVISVHGGATQSSCAIAASPPTAFEPLAREEPTHKASPNPHPNAAESTADDEGGAAIEDDLLSRVEAEVRVRNTFIEIWVPETLPLLRTSTAAPLMC